MKIKMKQGLFYCNNVSLWNSFSSVSAHTCYFDRMPVVFPEKRKLITCCNLIYNICEPKFVKRTIFMIYSKKVYLFGPIDVKLIKWMEKNADHTEFYIHEDYYFRFLENSDKIQRITSREYVELLKNKFN